MPLRFPAITSGNTPHQRSRRAITQEMERQASDEWRNTHTTLSPGAGADGDFKTIAAYDFMAIEVPPGPYLSPPAQSSSRGDLSRTQDEP